MTVLNGTTPPTRPLTPGVYAPIPTFFLKDTQDLDIPTLQKHVIRMANASIGILLCGSMGEAHHISIEERIEIIQSSRAALDSAGFTTTPIVAGTGLGSTRETIKVTKLSAEAGADYAIVIPSGYYAGALANDRKALKQFFKDVSEASPIPVMVYNYPGASGGIDMDSDLIEEMAAELPNLCGVKLTCGNVGKLTRIAATVSIPSFARSTQGRTRTLHSSFWVDLSTSFFLRYTLMHMEPSPV
jgi:L-threo-3-deoxy-hexylosonate aldolase